MQSSTRKRLRLSAIFGGALLILAGSALGESESDALRGSAVTPGSKAAELSQVPETKKCVAPTDEMRRNHMEYLKHDRDAVVHGGIRGVTYSLAQCVDCHSARDASGSFVAINGEKQFCDRCHDYTAVDIPCFQCHRKTPEGK